MPSIMPEQPDAASIAASLGEAARTNAAWRFDFWPGKDVAAERRRVRALFERHGFSVGRRQRGSPAGVLFGSYDIQKWRNLRKDERETLHGTLYEDDFPITASFPRGLPDHVDDALLAVSNADLAVRQALQETR